MTQVQLDRAVARATGESVTFVRRFGFSEIRPPAAPQWTRKARRLAARARLAYRPARPHEVPVLWAA
jgi:hypothetical protein